MARSQAFETYPQRYDTWFERHPDAYEAELRVLRRVLLPFRKGLEVGVGSGRFAAPLGFAFGVDPAFALLRQARARGLRVVRGVAEHLPVQTGSVDAVLLVTTVCFVDDLDRTFREIHRVLMANGFLVIGFVDRDSWLGQRYLREKERNPFYRDATFVSTSELLEKLNTAGFRTERIMQTLFESQEHPYGEGRIQDGYGTGAFVALRARKA